jgi:hypothetical protein
MEGLIPGPRFVLPVPPFRRDGAAPARVRRMDVWRRRPIQCGVTGPDRLKRRVIALFGAETHDRPYHLRVATVAPGQQWGEKLTEQGKNY